MTNKYGALQLPDVVHLQYNEDGYWTNLPVMVVDISKTGWEWGRNSPGSNDLALNILEWALRKRNFSGTTITALEGDCFARAFRMHYEFKRQVIAHVPLAGRSFTLEEVWAWIDSYKPSDDNLDLLNSVFGDPYS